MYPQRLTNLSQTDIAPLLPLPVVAEPASSTPVNSDSQVQQNYQPAVLEHVLALLQDCDTSYIVPKHPVGPDVHTPVQVGELHQALLSLDPGAFLTHPTGQSVQQRVSNANQTASSSSLRAPTLSLTAGVSDSISHSTASEIRPRKTNHRARKASEHQAEVAEVDLVAICNHSLQGFVAKQQAHQDGAQESQPAESDPDVDIDGMEGAAPKLGMQDMKGLNSKLTKLATIHSIHLLQKDQLLLLLGSLGAVMQQGESLLIGTNAEEDAQQQGQILMSLEACTACLQVLAAPGMPKQVYKEELIDNLVGFVRFQLMHNVLVFHDAALCQAQRPGLLSPDEEEWGQDTVVTSKKKTPKSIKKPVARVLARVPSTSRAIQSRLEVILQLIAQLMPVVQLQQSTLLPLLRVACQALTVQGLDLLQIKAAGLVVSIFQHCPQLQGSAMDEVLSQVLPCLPVGRRCPRAYLVGDDKSASIQVTVAMLVQMIQACVQLPLSSEQMDESADLRDCFAPAVAHSDKFWHGCFDRFPSAKVQKSDSDVDIKQLVEQIIIDLLRIQNLPAWPAASTLLIRCIHALGGPRGLQHPDASVRQISVDFLGLIAAHLFRDGLSAADNQAWLAQFAPPEGTEGADASHTVAQHLLLDFLAERQQQRDTALSCSARSFLTCRLFADELTALRSAGTPTSAGQSQMLQRYQTLAEHLDKGLKCAMNADEAAQLSSALVQQGPVGAGRKALLTWLISAADSTKQVATTRAKAIKALGLVAEHDPRLLALPILQTGVNRALQDDAVSVREAAVDLLGKHMSSKQDLALTYFEVLATAVRDPGTSVRKRAVNIMWESCVKQPGFPKATQACVHILTRATDPEESIQKLVSKVFHNLWFSPPTLTGESLTPQARAQQLAEVALAVYEAGCSAIHLPLEPSNPLLAILKQAVEREGDERAVGQSLANALLENVLQAVDEQADSFPSLIALHAFCLADVTLCMPPNDPASFARCLAPYLKVPAPDNNATNQQKRRSAEWLLCVLAIIGSLLSNLDRIAPEAAQDLASDLVQLINSHHYVQVVSGAAQTLSSLARLSPSAGQRLAALMTSYMEHLKQKQPLLENPPPNAAEQQTNIAHTSRFLFIVGQLVRHGGDLLQGSAPSDSPTADIKQLLAILVSFYNMPKGSLKVKEKALEGLGLLFVAHPAALLESAAVAAMQQALQPCAPIPLKLKVLSNLLELLKSEEEGLKVKQDETSEALQQQAEVGDRSVGEPGAGLVVPVQNGEGDSLNLSAGFIQSNWEAVKALALDTTTELHQQPTSPQNDTQSAAQVRRRALEVMEAVLRGGVMPPFSAVSTLFALTTDPTRDVSDRALRVLRKEAEKYIEVRSRLATLEGLQAASLFQQGLTQRPPSSTQSPPPAGLSEDACRGMAALYAQLLQPDRNLRTSFLRILVRCFDTASDLLSPGAASADPRLLAFCAHVAARLPFKRCDEPYTLLHHINATISRRAAFVLSAQKASLNATAQRDVQPNAHASTDPQQEGPADPRDNGAAPGDDDRAMQHEGGARQSAMSGSEAVAAETPGDAVGDQGQTAHQEGMEGACGRKKRKQSTGAGSEGSAECCASLALTMLLMLKRYLKATYSMSEERIAAFSPDLPDKRKQEERVAVCVQEGADLPLHCLRLEAPHEPSLWKEQYQVFKHYMKSDAPDYGEGTMPVRTNSKKRAQRTDSMQEGAVQGSAGIASADRLESRATDAGTPLLPEGVSPVVKGKAGKSQHSTAVRSGRGGSARSKTSTKGKPRPRKRAKVLQYMDDDDIDGVGDLHDDDDADDDFQAPGTSAAARKRLEPML